MFAVTVVDICIFFPKPQSRLQVLKMSFLPPHSTKKKQNWRFPFSITKFCILGKKFSNKNKFFQQA